MALSSTVHKVLLIGDCLVGKTSLLQRFTENTFTSIYIETIVDFRVKSVNLDGQAVKLQIWDTSGLERFKGITTDYYRGVNAIIIVYDATNMESFSNVKKWLGEVEQHAMSNVSKLLLGNKCDLENDKVVDYGTAKEFADEMGIPLLETSAKDTTNVELAFMTIVAQS